MSSVRIPRVPTYSGFCRPSVNFAYGIFTLSDLLFQNSSAIHIGAFRSPYPERISTFGLGSSDFARHYFRNRFYFLFLRVLRCFSSPGSPSVPRVPPATLCIHVAVMQYYCTEFPHSDICGSRNICFSPQLFAACHVLLRRHVPRHPPLALCSLIFSRSRLKSQVVKFNSYSANFSSRIEVAFCNTFFAY